MQITFPVSNMPMRWRWISAIRRFRGAATRSWPDSRSAKWLAWAWTAGCRLTLCWTSPRAGLGFWHLASTSRTPCARCTRTRAWYRAEFCTEELWGRPPGLRGSSRTRSEGGNYDKSSIIRGSQPVPSNNRSNLRPTKHPTDSSAGQRAPGIGLPEARQTHGPAGKPEIVNDTAEFRLNDYTMDDVKFVQLYTARRLQHDNLEVI